MNGQGGIRKDDSSVITWGGQCWSIASTLQSTFSERHSGATRESGEEMQKRFENGRKCLLVRDLRSWIFLFMRQKIER